jgi:hypothetical protein
MWHCLNGCMEHRYYSHRLKMWLNHRLFKRNNSRRLHSRSGNLSQSRLSQRRSNNLLQLRLSNSPSLSTHLCLMLPLCQRSYVIRLFLPWLCISLYYVAFHFLRPPFNIYLLHRSAISKQYYTTCFHPRTLFSFFFTFRIIFYGVFFFFFLQNCFTTN